MAVRYSATRPGEIEVGAKAWPNDDGTVNLNLYYADRVEHFVSDGKVTTGAGLSEKRMLALEEDTPVPFQPVSHFPNRAYGRYGRSELSSVLPLQDALN